MKELLDETQNPFFFIKSGLKKESEISSEIKKVYPFSISDKKLVVKKLKHHKERVCFLLDKKLENKKLFSFLLFVEKRAENGTFVLRTENYFEIVRLEEGKLPEVEFEKEEVQKAGKVFEIKDVFEASSGSERVQFLGVKKKRLKFLKLFFFSSLCFWSVLFFLWKTGNVKQAKLLNSINQEKLEKKAEQERKKKVKEVCELEKKYEKEIFQKLPDCWSELENFYFCAGDKVFIRELNLDKNHFSARLVCKNGIETFGSFESSSFFSNVKMSRLEKNETRELVTLSGDGFLKRELDSTKKVKEADDIEILEMKKNFYMEELSKIEEKKLQKSREKLSDFVKDLRKKIKNSGVKEKYIQSRENEKQILVEVMVAGQSSGILELVKSLCKKDGEIFKSLRLCPKEAGNELESVFELNTGIPAASGEKEEIEKAFNEKNEVEAGQFSAFEIGKIFLGQKNVKKRPEEKAVEKTTAQKKGIERKLFYLGKGRLGNVEKVFIQDRESGAVFDLFFENESNDSVEIILEGEKYEVKK